MIDGDGLLGDSKDLETWMSKFNFIFFILMAVGWGL